MTNTVSDVAPAVSGTAPAMRRATPTAFGAAPAVLRPDPRGVVDLDVVRAIAAEAAREITGVCDDVQVRATLARGAAVLSLRVPIRYPMPVWQVATVCRTHVRERMRDRIDIPVRRLDIEVSGLAEPTR